MVYWWQNLLPSERERLKKATERLNAEDRWFRIQRRFYAIIIVALIIWGIYLLSKIV